jgi:S1/P1 Nuclease
MKYESRRERFVVVIVIRRFGIGRASFSMKIWQSRASIEPTHGSRKQIVILMSCHRYLKNPLRVLAVLAVTFAIHGDSVQAWGRDGHEIVGNLAWQLLSNHTQGRIQEILGYSHDVDSSRRRSSMFLKSSRKLGHNRSELNSPLGQIADWADQVRHSPEFHWSGPLHYIDVRDDLVVGGCTVRNPDFGGAQEGTVRNGLPSDDSICHFDYTRDCPDDVCVAGAIVNYTRHLMEAELHANTLVVQSLKFITHFIGDIHQPLHSARETDRGGNSIHVHFQKNSAYLEATHVKGTMIRSLRHLVNSTELDNPLRIDRRKALEVSPPVSEHFRSFLRRKPSYSLNLHAVWDDSLIELAVQRDFRGNRAAYQDQILQYIYDAYWNNTHDSTDNPWAQWTSCLSGLNRTCTTLWGEESLQYALTFAYRHVGVAPKAIPIVDGDTLSAQYGDICIPLVQDRLAAAAVRLSWTLSHALSGSGDDWVFKQTLG